VGLYFDLLLKNTISKETLSFLLKCLRESGYQEATIAFFENLEWECNQYLSSSGAICPYSPVSWGQSGRFLKFESFVRARLLSIGSRLSLESFRRAKLPAADKGLALAGQEIGFELEAGTIRAVSIEPQGRARLVEETLLSLKGDNIQLDFIRSENNAHIVRFLSHELGRGTLYRMTLFRQLIQLIQSQGAETITGKAASSNDSIVFMPKGGDWRFAQEDSVWPSVTLSRLEKLWLRVGFVPSRLVQSGDNNLVLFSPEKALLLSEEWRKEFPAAPISYFYLCPKLSAYDYSLCEKLKK
jgi:hypothetical protein